MANTYRPPGVFVDESTSPAVSSLLAIPASLALVGVAAGTITRTDAISLVGTTPVVLPSVPTDASMVSGSIISVMDAINPALAPTGYTSSTDYTFSNTNHTIARQGGGIIPDGSTVYVNYTFTPKDYFEPIRLDNMSDIQDRFGNAWDATGTAILSRVSHAASIAFENGAQNIVFQPLFFNNAGLKQQPTSAQAAAAATWTDNFTALRDLEDVNIIVPVIGQSDANVGDSNVLGVAQALQDHVKYQKDNDQLVVGIFGEDASASTAVATKTTRATHAATIAARYASEVTQQMVMVTPARFKRPQPGSPNNLTVGGQYMAAAIAGMVAARAVSQSVTRKVISGFTSVDEFPYTKTDKNAEAATGLMVVEQRGNLLQVRHGVTLDTTSTSKRELSIVRAKHRMVESVRVTIDTQIIGQVIADGQAPLVVQNAVIAVLDALRSANDIVDFSDVQARTQSVDPTIIEVRFSYRPAYPVNYVNVVFALDLTSGTLTIGNTTAQANTIPS